MKLFRVLRRFFEETAYYISSITLFNLIYVFRIIGFNWDDCKSISTSEMIAFSIAVLLIVVGIIYTVEICCKDHSLVNRNTLGKTAEVISLKDITGDNYFSKYSLLVLTGNSLPMLHNVIGLVIYLMVLLTIGLIFVSQKMYYMNPIVTLLGYRVVQAECEVSNSKTDYYFMYKHGSINVGQKIRFLNITNKIIRLKEVKA